MKKLSGIEFWKFEKFFYVHRVLTVTVIQVGRRKCFVFGFLIFLWQSFSRFIREKNFNAADHALLSIAVMKINSWPKLFQKLS